MTFKELQGQDLAVLFIKEEDGRKDWTLRLAQVAADETGYFLRFPPSSTARVTLLNKWEERLRPTPASMRQDFGAAYCFPLYVSSLPKQVGMNTLVATGLNLNKPDLLA